VVSGALADVLSGGEKDLIDIVSEADLLHWSARLSCSSLVTRTQARVEQMLVTGKPLRN
jgi:3-hydroxyacyl-CoA dehydrogenase